MRKYPALTLISVLLKILAVLSLLGGVGSGVLLMISALKMLAPSSIDGPGTDSAFAISAGMSMVSIGWGVVVGVGMWVAAESILVLVNLGVDTSKILGHVTALASGRKDQPTTSPMSAAHQAPELLPRQPEA